MGILGMPALIELNTVEEHVALCARLGLNFVELNTNFPNQQLHLLDAKHLRALAEKHGIGYTIHLNDEMPVADFNPTVAKGYCDAVLEAISFADAIGANCSLGPKQLSKVVEEYLKYASVQLQGLCWKLYHRLPHLLPPTLRLHKFLSSRYVL